MMQKKRKETVVPSQWGGETQKTWIYQLSWSGTLATVEKLKR